jgi:hypothetical protein
MKNFKKLIAAATIAGVLGVTGAAYAVGATPAGIAASLTGRSVEEVTAQRATGTTYGAIANEAGKLDEFKTENLERIKAVLDQRVKDGSLTQARADQIIASIKTNQVNCDTTGSAGIGKMNGVGLGQGMGMGKGAGQHNGGGFGARMNR